MTPNACKRTSSMTLSSDPEVLTPYDVPERPVDVYVPQVFPQRLQVLGRIRLGDQVLLSGTNKRGGAKFRPRRLEHFRLTSDNKPRLEAAAKLYGGDVTEWANAPQGRQWQLYAFLNALDRDSANKRLEQAGAR